MSALARPRALIALTAWLIWPLWPFSLAMAQPFVPVQGNWQVQPHVHPVDAGAGKQINIWHVQGRVYMLVGAGPNIAVQLGDEATMVVNAGPADMSEGIVNAIRELTNRPIEFIIDTDSDAENVGGNAGVAKVGFEYTGAFGGEPKGAGIAAQQSVLDELVKAKAPPEQWPTDAYQDNWALFNDEAVLLTHAPAAHSNGNTYVYFRSSDVICTGNLFDPLSYPVIETGNGGSIDGIIDALNNLIDTMVPRQNEEGGTYVIPGHGRMTDRTEIVSYRDALTIIRARLAYDVSKGMTLDQIQAARPTYDYDGVYGHDTGSWTTRMFVAAVYHDVVQAQHAKGGRRAPYGPEAQ
jgi:glyoxylase-like metal-dependent hydrolase (beta-lactamase superfamily II)